MPSGRAAGAAAWTRVATRADLDGRDVLAVEAGGRRLAIYRLGDEVRATADACPHQGASLAEGCVVDGFIECPLHYALFDIRSGAADGGVTTQALATFPVRVEGPDVYVNLSGGEETAR